MKKILMKKMNVSMNVRKWKYRMRMPQKYF